ncbi:MAG: discoidin domain-containing protein [Smithellaceae bacterium]|nr:discoidin domain-containing protein [Smithellaceae bacterium]
MKGRIIWGLCLLFLLAGAVYAQDQMIIFFKDGKTQAIDLDRIQKIEYQATPVRENIPLIQDLPDRAFTASSYWANDLAGHGPPNARMGSTATFSNWSAGTNNPSQWIQVDLGVPSLLRAIGTKGRSRNANQWVTSYRLSTSVDGVNWHMYQQNGVDVTFRGNSDRETEFRHTLPSEVSARYLRFHPATWAEHITMRIEAYGIPLRMEHQATTIISGIAALPGIPVTLYWHMADNADVYLNGVPLRRYEPSFRTRHDEAPQPAFSASAVLKTGDVFTVGGRRGGSFGFMLIAVDSAGRVVFKTEPQSWRVYAPGDRSDWYQPAIAMASAMTPVTVQNSPWHPQVELNRKYANVASSIWGSPAERFCYLMATVQMVAHPAARAKTFSWTFQRIGDCPGNDVASTSGSAIPAPQHCNEKTQGLTAVCWDRGVNSVCTYKSVTAEQCTGGRSPGNLYKCTEF